MRKISICIFILIATLGFSPAQARDFKVIREMIPMRDGTQVATTLFMPKKTKVDEKFPVLLEMQPYRKDDLFLARDYALHSYFARQGYVVIKADVRGTGSSTGPIPDREYSDDELTDAEELIRHYAKQSWSNGKVGMWGISWSGFNALQTAMRSPPELKAIIAAHASDDLFHDDVHFIDGNFHVDAYELSIENDLSLPRSPDYKLDAEYFKHRFNREPWFLRYKREQQDGEFWQKESLRGQYHRLKTPTLLIGGMLDGYRDTLGRLLDFAEGPVRAILGPWSHAWPDHEWRDDATRWWDYWLKDKGERPKTGELVVFQRESSPPTWLAIPWREREKSFREIYFSRANDAGAVSVGHIPSNGAATGLWWGDQTPDMARDDADRVTFDSEPLDQEVAILGHPEVEWLAETSGPWVHWAVQLEDVFPDGRVELVTGAVLNTSQIYSREFPSPRVPFTPFPHHLNLHFTSWTFQPGHRIRVTFSHGQFPMIWPMPFRVTSRIFTGDKKSLIRLPLIPRQAQTTHEFSDAAGEFEKHPALVRDSSRWPREQRTFRDAHGGWNVVWKADRTFVQEGKEFSLFEETTHRTHDQKPWESSFIGRAGHSIKFPGRKISVRTHIHVRSDRRHFHIQFTRTAIENGRIKRRKVWRDKILRRFH